MNFLKELFNLRKTKPKRKKEDQWRKGDLIGDRYEVYDFKSGGMGIVYFCYDTKSQVSVALKTFQDALEKNPSIMGRFCSEAETWVRIDKHPFVVRADYVEKIYNRLFIILELIVGHENYGTDLSGWIKKRGLSINLALQYAIQICGGMLHAKRKFEEMGKVFVHRDLKPGNILITQDKQAKVTDFGLVKALEDSFMENITSDPTLKRGKISFTNLGEVMGSFSYISPEQWSKDKLDERSDIYSMGCVLYEMFTGHPPFHISSVDEWKNYKDVSPEPIEDIPKELNEIVLKCLGKKKVGRYQDFEKLMEDLQEIYSTRKGEKLKVDFTETELNAVELGNKGASLNFLGFQKEAIKIFDEAINLDPNFATAYNNRGNVYLDIKEHQHALEDYDRAIALDPNYAMAYNNRGAVYHDLKKYQQALKEFNQAIAFAPNYVMAYYNRGNIYRDLKQYKQALEDYDQAIAFDPNDAEVYNNRGLVYRDLKQYKQALQDFDQAIVFDPNDAMAYNNRGLVYRDLKQYKQALEDYDQAIAFDPNDAEAYNNRGNVYADLKEYQQALENFDRAITLNPNDAEAYNNRGNAYLDLKMYQQALEDYDQALSLDPDDALVYYNRGNVYRDLKKYQQALKDYDRAIALDPSVAEAYNNRGNAYLDLKKYQQALEDYDQAIKLDPNFSLAYNNRGTAFFYIENFKEALNNYQLFIKKAENVPEYEGCVVQVKAFIEELKSKLK